MSKQLGTCPTTKLLTLHTGHVDFHSPGHKTNSSLTIGVQKSIGAALNHMCFYLLATSMLICTYVKIM